MRPDKNRSDLDVNEALALLLGRDLLQFRQDNDVLIDELEREASICLSFLTAARETNDMAKIEAASLAEQKASDDLKLAFALRVKLNSEIGRAYLSL